MATRRPAPSSVARECLDNVTLRALRANTPVPEVRLPPGSTSSRVVQTIDATTNDASSLSPRRVQSVLASLDRVVYVEPKPKRRAPKRKARNGEGSAQSHARGSKPGGKGRADGDVVPEDHGRRAVVAGDGDGAARRGPDDVDAGTVDGVAGTGRGVGGPRRDEEDDSGSPSARV